MLGRLLALLALAACADFPVDTDGTAERAASGNLRVGWSADARADARFQTLVRNVAPRSKHVSGSIEPLLTRLEQGELDLVLGVFDRKSPWSKRVHFSKPVFAAGEGLEGRAALRNGEHRWAVTVDRAVLKATSRP